MIKHDCSSCPVGGKPLPKSMIIQSNDVVLMHHRTEKGDPDIFLCAGSYISHGESTFHPHDDVIKWKHFPRYWPFVRGIHRSR